MRVACFTMWSPSYQPLADISVPNFKLYCDKHGYQFHELVVEDNNAWFQKHLAFKEFFKGNIDAIFYKDVDSIITNLIVPVTSFIDDTHDFFITVDINELNGGSVIIKNNKSGKKFNDFVLSKREIFGNEQEVYNSPYDEFKNTIKVVSHPSFNSYPYEQYAPTYGKINGVQGAKPKHEEGCWQPGDFVCHVPGLPIDKRIEILKNIKVAE